MQTSSWDGTTCWTLQVIQSSAGPSSRSETCGCVGSRLKKKKKINVITVYILEQLSFNFSNHFQLLPCNKELPQQCWCYSFTPDATQKGFVPQQKVYTPRVREYKTVTQFSVMFVPPPAIVALISESSSSSPLIASCKWRGVIRFTLRSFDAFPANSRTWKRDSLYKQINTSSNEVQDIRSLGSPQQ